MSAYNSRSNSSSSISTNGSTERRSSSVSRAFKSVGQKLQQHHRDVTAAYEAYYGAMAAPKNINYAPRKSHDSELTIVSEETESKAAGSQKSGVWQKVKQAAKEHHESVNGAYEAYYGKVYWDAK